MQSKHLEGTCWIAHPDAYDYEHTLAFDRTRGFVIQGDGQALKWASFFDYSLENDMLNIILIPTEGIVGDDSKDQIAVSTTWEFGDYVIESKMGGPFTFTERLTLSKPIVCYEPDSVVYYRIRNIPFSEITDGFYPKPQLGNTE